MLPLTTAPVRIETARLTLRRPEAHDAQEIFRTYGSDAEVTRWLAWPTHRSVADTLEFIELSDNDWRQWPAGPYLLHAKSDGTLLGSTGLAFTDAQTAMTGYVLARSAWGKGYATEALQAMMSLARHLGVRRVYALCHPEHVSSKHVLEKAGFGFDSYVLATFPNLLHRQCASTLCYAVDPAGATGNPMT